MDDDERALLDSLAASAPAVVRRRRETPEERLARAERENDLGYLQGELVRLGYVDYGDARRCMKRGCRAAPAARASPCECRVLCLLCAREYAATLLRTRCPACLGRDTTFAPATPPRAVPATPRGSPESPAERKYRRIVAKLDRGATDVPARKRLAAEGFDAVYATLAPVEAEFDALCDALAVPGTVQRLQHNLERQKELRTTLADALALWPLRPVPARRLAALQRYMGKWLATEKKLAAAASLARLEALQTSPGGPVDALEDLYGACVLFRARLDRLEAKMDALAA